MRIGVVLPQTELGGDVQALRAYATGAEALGYGHVMIYDHVVGADPAVHAGWERSYDVDTTFHEPMVALGYLAAVTRLELVTGVLILPQRQTALVAKQAAELDLLAEGRLRLGVGIGWNQVEYEALGQDFGTRGKRLEEQIALLRRYWTERSITYHGTWDSVTGAGIAPMPAQRPIPVWIGANSVPAYRRTGRLADGWFPQMGPGAEFRQAWEIIAGAARAAGRDPAEIGIEARVSWRGDTAALAAQVDQWRELGAGYVAVNTMGAGLLGAAGHLAALTEAAEVLGLTGGVDPAIAPRNASPHF
jgi:probable F420-dependent oxidoreductase